MVDQEGVVSWTQAFVRAQLEGEASGHDWWHVHRVWRTAVEIGSEEGVDLFVVQLAALLHDIADAKFHDGDEEIGPHSAADWLRSLGVDEQAVERVAMIIRDLSFKGAGVQTPMSTREGMVVQDADRLDALGAIGIARAFAYGGFRGQVLYDPEDSPVMHATVDAYRSHRGSTLNHFFEKLLLKDRMNTEPARRIAGERHRFMERFVSQFSDEWDGWA
ncbi:MAG TPA: HD domain-containing protein [Thermomicrobiales bacterium]|nr:HD domain-containing protein [Thermomicrobiales bacterium]